MVVFKIQNKVTGQNYVGSCRSDIFERWELYVRAAEAGLDFPLYQEIRELGEAKFTISELDFAEEISELKEMELLHTVEQNAKSLRRYKFGRTDAVVKRCSKAELDSAWKKDLPLGSPLERPERETPRCDGARPENGQGEGVARFGVTSEPAHPAVSDPRPSPADVAAPRDSSPVARSESSPAKTNGTSGDQFDKALFAQGVGLLARTLDCAEGLSRQVQDAESYTQALHQAVAASGAALSQLVEHQHEAAERARAALAAAEASAQANDALQTAQRHAAQQAEAVAGILKNIQQQDELQDLQQGLAELLGQLKPRNERPPAVDPVKPEPEPEPEPSGEKSALVEQAEAAEIAAQEAKMVNRLKGLQTLLAAAEPAPEKAPAGPELPVRAWVASSQEGEEAPQVLEKKADAATVLHRRSRRQRRGETATASRGRRAERPTLSIRSRY